MRFCTFILMTNESYWTDDLGNKIFRTASPVKNPKVSIGIVHGLGEHIGRYKHVFKFFNNKGASVYGYDSFGHGKSEGKRGHILSYDQWLDEIDMMLNWMKGESPGVPKVIYGHSLGGNNTLNYILKRENLPNACVATGPFIEEAMPTPKIKITMGRFMNNILPGFALSNGLPKNKLSRDMVVNNAYYTDPLVHGKITVRAGAEALDAAAWLRDNTHETKIPLLVMHGSADELTSFSASKIFAETTKGPVAFKAWPDAYHEIHNELNKEEVLEYAWEWLSKALGIKSNV